MYPRSLLQSLSNRVFTVLFAVAILLGIKGGGSYIGLLLVLLGLAAITVREPMLGTVLERMGFRS